MGWNGEVKVTPARLWTDLHTDSGGWSVDSDLFTKGNGREGKGMVCRDFSMPKKDVKDANIDSDR